MNSFDLSRVVGIVSIHYYRDLVEARNQALEYSQPFTDQLRCIHRSASHIRAWTIKTLYEPESDRIVDGKHHDWNAGCCGGSGNGCRRIGREHDLHFAVHKFGHHTMIICVENAFAIFDTYVLVFYISEVGQSFLECAKPLGIDVPGSRVAQGRG